MVSRIIHWGIYFPTGSGINYSYPNIYQVIWYLNSQYSLSNHPESFPTGKQDTRTKKQIIKTKGKGAPRTPILLLGAQQA